MRKNVIAYHESWFCDEAAFDADPSRSTSPFGERFRDPVAGRCPIRCDWSLKSDALKHRRREVRNELFNALMPPGASSANLKTTATGRGDA
ncbi:unnamed protein product [Heligmosomoides polygyrus]|uniref:BHLH domain-containing protein n=1 Tax=Heligmosomoides polygyrus TaxID=6339 RepID=A0A183FFW5_HELPZ|nr:unnamed protein product [Heligmosomoides polygyrus]